MVEVDTLVAQIGGAPAGAGGVEETPRPDAAALAAAQDVSEAHLDPNSDAAIVRDCLEGNTERFRELVARYTRMVAVFAFSRLGSREAADEVAQETMVRAYEMLPSLRAHRSFSNWLMAIANNITLGILNEQKRSVPLEGPGEGGAGGAVAYLAASAHARSSKQSEPHAELSRTELWQRILAEVNSLPPRYATVVALKHQGGMSCKEIAESLGLPLGTVTGRLSRAYSILRAKMGTEALE